MNEQFDDDPWLIPLHGAEAPAKPAPLKPFVEEVNELSLFTEDDELPTIEFRPRLRRSA